MSKRTLVCGDIHGAYKALVQVLERCNYNPEEDRLIFLGDYVDGWSESAQVIQFLIELTEKATHEPIFIRGNHDVWCGDWLNFGTKNPNWEPNGGRATIESYLDTGFLVEKKHRDFFYNLIDYYIDEENNLFVHGGFKNDEGAQEEYKWILHWDRSLWDTAVVLHSSIRNEKRKNYRSHLYKEIFLGHTTTGSFMIKPHFPEYQDENQAKNGFITVPMHRLNIWNLDTGGGHEGKISIMDIKTKEYWQSDFVKLLYKKN